MTKKHHLIGSNQLFNYDHDRIYNYTLDTLYLWSNRAIVAW